VLSAIYLDIAPLRRLLV